MAALGSAGHAPLVRETLWRNGNDLLLHAAACKHVPLIEANRLAGFANNLLATDVVARATVGAGVGRGILVSTDKAVAPSNVRGATKRLAERVSAREGARGGRTRFATVRFGSVFGYSGSVVQVFRQQIAAGGPVTVSDPAAMR